MADLAGNRISFGQRMGTESLPSQLKLNEISQELSSLLWAITHDSIKKYCEYGYGSSYVKEPWRTILRSYFVLRMHGDLDDFSEESEWMLEFSKNQVYRMSYIKTWNFIDFVISSNQCPKDYYNEITMALERTQAAYRVTEKQIVPVGSDENAKAILDAFKITDEHSAKGPSKHLRLAARELTEGKWASSVRESIHAIESAAKILEPNANTLGPALSKLEERCIISSTQRKAFGALYGYSSDTEGVRHALTFNDVANVTERDAMFMFGACAAFASYLLSAS